MPPPFDAPQTSRRRRRGNSRNCRSTSASTTVASGSAASSRGSSSSHSSSTATRSSSPHRPRGGRRRCRSQRGERQTALTLADGDITQRQTAPPPSQTSSSLRRLRGGCQRYRSHAARDRQRSRSRTATLRSDQQRHRHHRRGGRRGRRHRRPHREYSLDPSRRPTGSLPPISRRLKARIGGDFASWSGAWSLYASVLTSFHPRLAPSLAPCLFHYQHFITLKSSLDTELWASCFATHGLSAAYQPLPLYPATLHTRLRHRLSGAAHGRPCTKSTLGWGPTQRQS